MSLPITCLVFYAGQFVEKLSFFPTMGYLGPELYNGAFILVAETPEGSRRRGLSRFSNGWYRCDGTPWLTEQVPEELRTLALLLT